MILCLTFNRNSKVINAMINKVINKIFYSSKVESSGSNNGLYSIKNYGDSYISPETICKKNTVEQLCEKAENYFQNITDPTPFISRPFANFSKSPESLVALGLLLSGLHLGKTMKILEFGAGVCWLSRLLNQMGVSTISVDCSKSAIKTGKKLFENYPIIGQYITPPQFSVYDGHRLDIQDNHVDRIVCFDSFHHVPNIEEILREFHRVLKEGGIIGFAEPGLCHSFSPQSQTEMKNYGVLERDIRLDEIKTLAEDIGFTKLSIKMSGNPEISYDEYRSIVNNGSISGRIQNYLTRENRNRTVFFLRKGALQLDSRNGHGLMCDLKFVGKTIKIILVEAGQPIKLKLRVKNSGSAKWLHSNVQELGVVKIGGHLLDKKLKMIDNDFFRMELGRDISPSETFDSDVAFNAPSKKGKYIICIDMVSEHICWFENCGSQPIFFEIQVS